MSGSGNPAEPVIRPAAIADLPGTAHLAVAGRGGEHAQWQARFAADHRLGFREVTRDFTYPGVTFTGGAGVLCRAWLTPAIPSAR